MALTKTNAWSLGTVGLCAALVAGSWFLLIEPQRAEAAESREQTVAASASNAELEVRIEQLRAEFADLPERQAELAAIRQALPGEPALALLIRDIDASAVDAGVTIDSITTGAVAAVVDPAAAVVVAEEPADGEAAAEPSAEPSAAPSAEAVPADGTAGVTAVDGAPAGAVLASVPITIEATGGFFATNLLVKQLQTDITRALLIDGLAITVDEEEDAEPGDVKTSITAQVFVFVDPQSVDTVDAAPGTTD